MMVVTSNYRPGKKLCVNSAEIFIPLCHFNEHLKGVDTNTSNILKGV